MSVGTHHQASQSATIHMVALFRHKVTQLCIVGAAIMSNTAKSALTGWISIELWFPFIIRTSSLEYFMRCMSCHLEEDS